MKKSLIAALLAASLAHADTLDVQQPAKPHDALQLSSSDLKEGATLTQAQVANAFGCSGENISPALQWKGVPKAAKTLVLTVYDPDAPTGSGFWHWAVYNIPADSDGLPANAGASADKLPATWRQATPLHLHPLRAGQRPRPACRRHAGSAGLQPERQSVGKRAAPRHLWPLNLQRGDEKIGNRTHIGQMPQ